jgi:hypothetical protein
VGTRRWYAAPRDTETTIGRARRTATRVPENDARLTERSPQYEGESRRTYGREVWMAKDR